MLVVFILTTLSISVTPVDSLIELPEEIKTFKTKPLWEDSQESDIKQLFIRKGQTIFN